MRASFVGYPTNYAVRAVFNVQQHANSRAKQSAVQFQLEELVQSTPNVKRVPISSSAYRVTISPAAMQKIDTFNATLNEHYV